MQNKRRIIVPIVLAVLFLALTLIGIWRLYVPPLQTLEEAVYTVVEAYQSQNTMALQSCYKKSRIEVEADAEIEFEKKFYLAVGAQQVYITGVERLLDKSNYIYVGVSFDFIMNAQDKIPYYEHLILTEAKDGSYHIVTKQDIPRDVIDYFEENSEAALNSTLYKVYKEQEKEYANAHMDYADQIYTDIGALIEGIPLDMEKNLQFMGFIFLVAILELGGLYCWSYFAYARTNQYIRNRMKRKIKRRLEK